jgi:RHS repeat-associated protein
MTQTAPCPSCQCTSSNTNSQHPEQSGQSNPQSGQNNQKNPQGNSQSNPSNNQGNSGSDSQFFGGSISTKGGKPKTSKSPVRYADGVLLHREDDLDGGGFGIDWGHRREFHNQLSNGAGDNGNNWMLPYDAYLISDSNQITVVKGGESSLWFEWTGSEWESQFGNNFKIDHEDNSNQYVLTDTKSGLQSYFHDFSSTWSAGKRGRLSTLKSAGGQTATISRDGSTGRISQFTISSGTSNVTYLYSYNTTGKISQVNQFVTLSPTVASARVANFTYYDSSESYGNYGDLKKVVVQNQVGSGSSSTFQTLKTSYYRYYKPGETGGYNQGLRYIVGPDAWQAMVDASINPETATNAQIASYADNYLEYDSERRVTKKVEDGGTRTTMFAYSVSPFKNDPNLWKFRTTEMRSDGSSVTVYSNWLTQVIFKVWKSEDGSKNWYEYKKYNKDQQRVLLASSAAIESYTDNATGLTVNLKPYDGLVERQTWYGDVLEDTITGEIPDALNGGTITRTVENADKKILKNYLYSRGYSKGYLGNTINTTKYFYEIKRVYPETIVIESPDYMEGDGSRTITIGTLKWRVLPTGITQYRSDTDGGSDPASTYYLYSFYEKSLQYSKRTTVLPEVPTAENGDGVTYQIQEYYDPDGSMTWKRDQLGYITKYSHDATTGALVQRIDDVDSSIATDSPWTTPTGGGLHLVTDYEYDFLGRQILELGPSHMVDLSGVATSVRSANYTVYRDDLKQVWRAAGYATGSAGAYAHTTVNPVSITIHDEAQRVTEVITASRSGTGRLSSSDSFPQSSYLSWTVNHYNNKSQLGYTREYSSILSSGDGINGTHYVQTNYGYDWMGHLNRIQSPGGTITRRLFDNFGNLLEVWVGTNDSGATDYDPTGHGASGNNMVLVVSHEYDGGAGGGNGLLTKTSQMVTGYMLPRVTTYDHDWRNRMVSVSGEMGRFQLISYDNLNRVISEARYKTNASGQLLAKAEYFFDPFGRNYRSKRYGVSSTGTVGNALVKNRWFDGRGLLIKQKAMNSRAWNKYVYDGVGRQVASYLSIASTDDGATNSVTSDTVVEQAYTDYDAASSVTGTRRYLRNHDATGTGALNGPSGSQPKARVYYSFAYQDGIGRDIATADYGTNGGTAPTRPSAVPSSTDTLLVNKRVYDAASRETETIDPAGVRSKVYYDAMGRTIKTVENYTGASNPGTADTDKTTEYSYSLDGKLGMLTVKNSITGDQVTRWEYGTTLSDSTIASSMLLRAKIYPDSDDATNPLGNGADAAFDRVEYTYDRQGKVRQMTDQNGTVHGYTYDMLGRLTDDQVTSVGEGIDTSVMHIHTDYDDLGRRTKVTSYDAYVFGSVVNEVSFNYNDFGQIIEDAQAHAGSVGTSTPKISYSYEDGSGGTVRMLTTNYNAGTGSGVSYSYGDSSSIDDAVSRVKEIRDFSGTSALASYAYLGAGTFVDTTYPDAHVELTYLKQGTEATGDAGDAYNGLDRFGRIIDQRWRQTQSGSSLVRLQYGYNVQSQRKWRRDLVAAYYQDEFYTYDGLSQLKNRDLGSLNTGRTAISGAPKEQEAWTYDPAGNWRNRLVKKDWNTVLNQDRTQNPANEILSIAGLSAPVGYDKAGNMTRIPYLPGTSPEHYVVVWDAWNRLKRVTYTPIEVPGGSGSTGGSDAGSDSYGSVSGSAGDTGSGSGSEVASAGSSSSGITAAPVLDVVYEYDGLFRRTRKQVLAGSTAGAEYYWNLDWKCVVQRYYGTSTISSVNYYGARDRNDLILKDLDGGSAHSGSRFYALGDAMFSTMAVVRPSSNVSERYRYSAFGERTIMDGNYNPIPESLMVMDTFFHGEQIDEETGWYNYGFRYYVPQLGVWPSRDPIGQRGGLNLYSITNNDIINKSDFLGLIDMWNPWPAGGHSGQTDRDVSNQIAALQKIESTKDSIGRSCFTIRVFRDASLRDISQAVNDCDYTFIQAHGGRNHNKEEDKKRTILLSDFNSAPTDDISKLFDKNGKSCTISACYVYPDFNKQSPANRAMRGVTQDILKLIDPPPTCCPTPKKLCMLLGPDVRQSGMPSYHEETPAYNIYWNRDD